MSQESCLQKIILKTSFNIRHIFTSDTSKVLILATPSIIKHLKHVHTCGLRSCMHGHWLYCQSCCYRIFNIALNTNENQEFKVRVS